MSKYVHNTTFLNTIFSHKSEKIEKWVLPFRLSLILLNRPISLPIFKPLYAYASHTILWDGATNRLYDSLEKEQRELFLPTHIIGDLDSAKLDIIDYYAERGVKVVKDIDEDHNDFEKSMNLLKDLLDLK